MTTYNLTPPACFNCGNSLPCLKCKMAAYKRLAETARLTSRVQEEAAKKVMNYEHWYQSAFDVDIKIVEPKVEI
jgi:hypothetical protein